MNKLLLLIEKILNFRLRGSITIHFDGLGGFKEEMNLSVKGDEVYKLLTNKKE